MAMQGFLSQLLGQGAGRSMADFNKQQQINQLLRQGWVPKGQDGITDQPVEGVHRTTSPEVDLNQTGSESGDLDAMMRMAEAIGDPELVKIINEMFGVTDPASSANTLDAVRANASEDPLMNSLMQGESADDDPSMASELVPDPTRTPDFSEGITSATPEDRMIANEYISEIKKDPTATYPTVGGLTIEEQPNALSIQALVSEYTNSLDYDSSVTSFEQQQVTSKPPVAPDGKRWTWSIDDNGWELSDAMPVSDTDLVNPDPKSRAFISEQFAPMRKKLTGLVPSGKAVGGFLKPVAEQLNAMFGSSTPLDMDGYEMGPYHAQRIQHEQGLLDERTRRDMVARDEMQREQWNKKNKIDQQAIRQRLIGSLLTFASASRLQAALRKFDKLEATRKAEEDAKPKIDPDQALTPEEMDDYQPRIDKLVGILGDMLDETGWTDYKVGYHAFNLDWWYEDFDTIMKGINLMMGLTQEGGEPVTKEELEASTKHIVSEAEQRKIVEILGSLNYIHGIIFRSEEIRYRAMTGENIPYSQWREQNREAQMLKTLEAVLKRWKSKTSGKTGNVDEDALARQANGRTREESE